MANNHLEIPPVLTCWKDIAQYLGKGVRTVQRWEQEFGLPVRRPNGIEHKSPVAAHPGDLDEWLQQRWSARNRGKSSTNPALPNGKWASPQIPITNLIQASRELRFAHEMLVAQTSAALEALVRTCAEMRESKHMLPEGRLFPAAAELSRILPPPIIRLKDSSLC